MPKALFIQTLVGIFGEQSGLHKLYPANTVRNRRVLSFFVLGGLILANEKATELLDRLKRRPFDPVWARGCIKE